MPQSAAATETAMDLQPSSTASGQVVEVTLKFVGVTFDPSDLYDALNAQWGTVSNLNDRINPDRRYSYNFLVKP